MKCVALCSVFFFQAEDGIRDAQESRGLGDVYKRQEKQITIALIPLYGISFYSGNWVNASKRLNTGKMLLL